MKRMINIQEQFNPAFWDWFKRSKVVDERGMPLVVYHGSSIDWHKDTEAEFSLSKLGSGTDAGDAGAGFYFADSEVEARSYGRFVGKFYLSIQNPLIIGDEYVTEIGIAQRKMSNSESPGVLPTVQKLANMLQQAGIKPPPLEKEKIYQYMSAGDLIAEVGGDNFRRGVIKSGYDGVYWFCEWVAYYPEQIKSVDNKGTWDKRSPNIYERSL